MAMNYQERWQFRHANDTFWQRVEEASSNAKLGTVLKMSDLTLPGDA